MEKCNVENNHITI